MSYAENPYQSPFGTPAQASVDVRADFITKTYVHLLGAVAAFVALEVVFFQIGLAETIAGTVFAAGRFSWLLVLGAFMVVSFLAERMARSAVSPGTQYAGLGLYVVAEALIFCPLLYLAVMMEQQGADILGPAAVITLVLFTALTAIVFMTRKDFSFLSSILWFGAMAAFMFILAAVFFGFNLGIFFVIAMITLMCGFILYETSNVLHHYLIGQHVAAALALFASLATLFWYVIQLMMYLSDD